jgi:hypothetical protein
MRISKKGLRLMLPVVLMLIALSAAAVYGENYYYNVSESDLADGLAFYNGFGGEPFGYDPDKPPPQEVMVKGPDGYGDSCFQALVGATGNYASFRMSPKDIFGRDYVTLGDLDVISYFTSLVNPTSSTLSFQLKIYTVTETNPPVNWYGKRFNTIIPSYVDTDWHQNSTATNLTFNSMYDKDGGTGWNTINKTLTEISTEYSTLQIEFIDIIASYMTSPPQVFANLDGVIMKLDNGDEAFMNLVVEGEAEGDIIPPNGTASVSVTSGSEVEIISNTEGTTKTITLEESAIDQGKNGFAGAGGGKAFDNKLIINSSLTNGTFVATVEFHYTEDELSALGVSETWLTIRTWDEGTSTWVLAVSQNTAGTTAFMGEQEPDAILGHYGTWSAENYCWANVDHFTEFAAGQDPTVPVELSTFSLD